MSVIWLDFFSCCSAVTVSINTEENWHQLQFSLQVPGQVQYWFSGVLQSLLIGTLNVFVHCSGLLLFTPIFPPSPWRFPRSYICFCAAGSHCTDNHIWTAGFWEMLLIHRSSCQMLFVLLIVRNCLDHLPRSVQYLNCEIDLNKI